MPVDTLVGRERGGVEGLEAGDVAVQHALSRLPAVLAEVGPAVIHDVVAGVGAPGRVGREETDEKVDDGRLEGVGGLRQAVRAQWRGQGSSGGLQRLGEPGGAVG